MYRVARRGPQKPLPAGFDPNALRELGYILDFRGPADASAIRQCLTRWKRINATLCDAPPTSEDGESLDASDEFTQDFDDRLRMCAKKSLDALNKLEQNFDDYIRIAVERGYIIKDDISM